MDIQITPQHLTGFCVMPPSYQVGQSPVQLNMGSFPPQVQQLLPTIASLLCNEFAQRAQRNHVHPGVYLAFNKLYGANPNTPFNTNEFQGLVQFTATYAANAILRGILPQNQAIPTAVATAIKIYISRPYMAQDQLAMLLRQQTPPNVVNDINNSFAAMMQSANNVIGGQQQQQFAQVGTMMGGFGGMTPGVSQPAAIFGSNTAPQPSQFQMMTAQSPGNSGAIFGGGSTAITGTTVQPAQSAQSSSLPTFSSFASGNQVVSQGQTQVSAIVPTQPQPRPSGENDANFVNPQAIENLWTPSPACIVLPFAPFFSRLTVDSDDANGYVIVNYKKIAMKESQHKLIVGGQQVLLGAGKIPAPTPEAIVAKIELKDYMKFNTATVTDSVIKPSISAVIPEIRGMMGVCGYSQGDQSLLMDFDIATPYIANNEAQSKVLQELIAVKFLNTYSNIWQQAQLDHDGDPVFLRQLQRLDGILARHFVSWINNSGSQVNIPESLMSFNNAAPKVISGLSGHAGFAGHGKAIQQNIHHIIRGVLNSASDIAHTDVVQDSIHSFYTQAPRRSPKGGGVFYTSMRAAALAINVSFADLGFNFLQAHGKNVGAIIKSDDNATMHELATKLMVREEAGNNPTVGYIVDYTGNVARVDLCLFTVSPINRLYTIMLDDNYQNV